DRRKRGIRAFRKAHAWIGGIRLEHDARPPLPFAQTVGSRADRPLANISARGFDDLARDDARGEEVLDVGIVWLPELHLNGVAIERAQACDRAVVIELRTPLARRVDDLARADDQVGDDRIAAAAQIRIEPALE